ncbi:MAG: hypothetical protein J6S67_02215 [Methanobrevibacter sp.]|nr:hypothetical protein [Methanobrevibacter sp.]
MSKLVYKENLGELTGSVYTGISSDTFTYKVRYNKQVVARSYVYLRGLEQTIARMRGDMEILTNQGDLFRWKI